MIRPTRIGVGLWFLLASCAGTSEEMVSTAGIFAPPPAPLPCPDSPNCVSSLAPSSDTVHGIAPLEVDPARTSTPNDPNIQAELKALILAMPRTRLVQETPGYLHFTFTSQLFRFVDDVEIWFPQTQDSAPQIQIRSASRVGYGDMGVNRARVESIRQVWVEATRAP